MTGKSAGLSAVAEEPKEEGVTRLFIVGETADYALCQSALRAYSERCSIATRCQSRF